MAGHAPVPTTVHVPDGTAAADALARTTDLAVVAHPDDLELLVPGVIGACAEDPERWFTGVVCTDGAGSVTPPGSPGLTGRALVERRAAEQRAAADLGRYSAVVLLGRPSDALHSERAAVVDELAGLVARTRPSSMYTHDLADKHRTHVAVATAVVDAVRRLPADQRPTALLGCEAWRDLSWLPDEEKVLLDVTGHERLADDLLACFASQLGAKRYDEGAAGRRRANATFLDPRAADSAREVVVAMDLSPLLDEGTDPVELVTSAIDRFRAEVVHGLRRSWPDDAG